ncbi:DNA cytosine methyltransferase [Camelimonas abortus]|uniref:DNA (cytosine-5-)-methyltransferase n=1 Tax=Camelimonas abortus TaxID=1017184 RepID=A0ABV7LGQ3_9HYPH
MSDSRPTFYEFFAGGGMARAGLGDGWRCVFANDFDHKKALTYQANWGAPGVIQVGDIRNVRSADLPGTADLAWASFPCQDLSLAGAGAGLKGARSGTFYAFWDIIGALAAEGRTPRIVALENVTGALSSHGGQDFAAICDTFAAHGYACGALVIDAVLFVPQSRPRLFVIGVRRDMAPPPGLLAPGAVEPFHTRSLRNAMARLSPRARAGWLWWNIPTPPQRNQAFADLIEDNPASVSWHTPEETAALMALMSPVNLAKVEAARRAGRRMVGAIYRRTRTDASGAKAQRAEVRFDDVAGCLRTPAGGSSRQVIMVVDGERIRTRLISARETARLMGLPDDYRLPRNYNEAYHLTGDGVAAPVVRHLAHHLFEPLLGLRAATPEGAARPARMAAAGGRATEAEA